MAGTITVAGYPSSRKTPGFNLSVILGGPGTSAGKAPIKELHIGQSIPSTLTGSAPTFSVTAGTQAAAVPVPIFSNDESASKWGQGSELHKMAQEAFAQDPGVTLWQIASPAGTGTSTGIITFTGSVGAAFTARVVINGKFIDVSVAVGDSLTTIATNIATAINQQTDWPVTAQFALGVLTITAKCVGLRGNRITFRIFLINSTTTVKATGGTLAVTLSGVTATLSGGTAVGSTYHLSGGSAAESLTAALAAINPQKFDRIVLAQDDATSLDAVMTQVNAQAGVLIQQRQQVIACCVDTLANATTLATGRNQARLQIGWHYAADMLPGQIAAQVTAARVGGDASAGGVLAGEGSKPSVNLDGLMMATIPAQDVIGDQPTGTQIESALNNGLTPLAANPVTGKTTLVRSITSRSQDASTNPNYGVIDTEFVTVPDYEAENIVSQLSSMYRGFNLAPDNADGSGPKVPNVTTPKTVESVVFGIMKSEEGINNVINVDLHRNELVCLIDPAGQGTRLLMDVPCVPAPNLHQVAGNLRQLSA
jgi:phage tail sheath gpL-like